MGRLDEHLPGLFFTPSGRCLDLLGPDLRWENSGVKKVDNDNDGNSEKYVPATIDRSDRID